jgi:tetratricopeptide (TPR) repeat protein
MRTFALAVGVLIALSAATFAATDQDYTDCQQTQNVDRGIAACTRILNDPSESAADRAAMYVRRGFDYLSKNDFDNAIADDSAALKLDPRNVYAVSNRAVAYARQGERDRAIADYAEARKLDPAAVASNRELVQIGAVAARAASLQNSRYLGDRIKNASDREAYRYTAYLARTPAPEPPRDLSAWVRASRPVVKPTQAVQEAVALIQQELSTAHDNAYIADGLLVLARVHAGLGDMDAAANEFEQAFTRAPYNNRYDIILGEIFVGYPKASAAIDNYIASFPPSPPPFSATASEDEKTTIHNAAWDRERSLLDAATLLSFIGDTTRAKVLVSEAKNIDDSYPDMIYGADRLASVLWLAGDSASAWQTLRNLGSAGQPTALNVKVPKGLRSTLDRVLCGPYADYLENASASLRAVSDNWISAHPSDDDTYLEYWRNTLAQAVDVEIACGMRERAAKTLTTLADFNKTRPPAARAPAAREQFEWWDSMTLKRLQAELDGGPPSLPDTNDPAHRELQAIIETTLRSGDYQAAISAAVNNPTARQGIVEVAARADRIDVVRQVIAIEKFPYFHLTLATEALGIAAHLPKLP